MERLVMKVIYPFSPSQPLSASTLVKLLTTVASLLLEIRSGVFSTRNLCILVAAEVSLDTVALPVDFLRTRRHSSHKAVGPAPSDGLAVISNVWGDIVTSADAVGDALVGAGEDVLVFVSVASGTDPVVNSDRATAAEVTDVFAFEKFTARWAGLDGEYSRRGNKEDVFEEHDEVDGEAISNGVVQCEY
ncbi:hypothetical protein V502_03180 [Pseudogymnoascus sp. VKM F-4520 (FW-2644)]|nr:hypothetical protein V502_03180 [Pseudogymnoascus sp. VKM F-4520 (FW-2644)]